MDVISRKRTAARLTGCLAGGMEWLGWDGMARAKARSVRSFESTRTTRVNNDLSTARQRIIAILFSTN